MAKKAKTTITRPQLASYRCELSPEGLPQVRLDYVTDGDLLFGPHHELWLTMLPHQALGLAEDLLRLAGDSRDRLGSLLAARKK